MRYINSYKLFENVQRSKKLLHELNIPDDNEDYIKLRELLKTNPGYLGKFTEWIFKDEFTFDQLENIYNELTQFKLDKPIEDFETPESVYDYITKKKSDIKVNQVTKSLPSRSRKLVNQELIDLIFNNLKYSKNIIDFYSKKGGRYKNIDDLISDTTNLIKNLSGGWDVDSIDYNEDELVYRDGSTLILHIDDYGRSCKLGSTHWCISTDKEHWNNYTKDFNKQYFIYDFTKKISDKSSMIGVTVGANGKIKNAHYRNDDECKFSELGIYSQYLTPYSKEYVSTKINMNSLSEVVKYGFIDRMKELIEQGQDPSLNNNFAIRLASENGNANVVRLLLQDPRVDPSDMNNYVIRLSSENGHTDVVRLLLQDPRVDPSASYNYAIRLASENGHTEVVRLLLSDPRVDPSASYNYAIRLSSENGHTDVVKLLLQDKRVDPSADDNLAIRISSYYGHTDVVKLLLQDKRVDPSDVDNYALEYSSKIGYTDVVRLLLSDPRVDPSDDDNSVIRLSSYYGHTDIVRLLLQDPRVVNSLSEKDLLKYKSMIQN